ncbi:hypothetical protein MUP79_09895 [Candidatus Bathyarchaeota archaeon]|nr:hypothetical protein [Candidatus Bathyarchaeota archaeon]
MSVNPPNLTIALGSVGVPQGDVIEARVHLGATKEVSSWELLLQNWNGKYSPGGTYPLSVGQDGYICIGRGNNVPQIITTRTESVKYESSPSENYVRVSGRCWGEKLFRQVVTKVYSNQKGEAIVKDLLDYFSGISHNRSGQELVENTSTTFSLLEYENTPVWDIIRAIAAASDDAGVIGYDFRVAPDGKAEFFPRNSKSSSVSLSEKIEYSEYRKDIHRVRNKITIYGAPDKSVPLNKDAWTESLTPSDGVWSATSGTVSLDTNVKMKGSASIKLYAQNLYYGSALFTLDAGKEVNANLYPLLNLWVVREAAYNGQGDLSLFDRTGKRASRPFTVGKAEWFKIEHKVGEKNADGWNVESGFDWNYVWQVRVALYFDGAGTGSFWVDNLFFGGRRYSSMQENTASQTAYGLRMFVDTDEELYSDNECMLRAKAILASLKDLAEYLTIRSTVIDYGNAPLLPGDKITVVLPNENVNAYFRILSVVYFVDAKAQTLEITIELGREIPLLADYMYALRSKTDHLSRHKIARS